MESEHEKFMKSPAGILLKDRPYSVELDRQLEHDVIDEPDWWNKMSYKEAIREVQEIADKYRIGSGWVHGEGIEDGDPICKRELKELKAVIRHMKKVYNKIK
jgi:hypothetical protein|tara:strand:+ start:3048 stop:3353 length:306 start_codon:yes stop_codon:yes gene_type:complete